MCVSVFIHHVSNILSLHSSMDDERKKKKTWISVLIRSMSWITPEIGEKTKSELYTYFTKQNSCPLKSQVRFPIQRQALHVMNDDEFCPSELRSLKWICSSLPVATWGWKRQVAMHYLQRCTLFPFIANRKQVPAMQRWLLALPVAMNANCHVMKAVMMVASILMDNNNNNW